MAENFGLLTSLMMTSTTALSGKIAFLSTLHLAVLAAIIGKGFISSTILFVLGAFVTVHSGTADRAFDKRRQQVRLLRFIAGDRLIPFGLCQQFDLRSVPQFLGNNALMQSIDQKIVVLRNLTVLISCAVNFFEFAPTESNFAAIDRVP